MKTSKLRTEIVAIGRIDIKYLEGAHRRVGFLANVRPTTVIDQTSGAELAAIHLFFVEPSGSWFKAKLQYNPYFYILCDDAVVK